MKRSLLLIFILLVGIYTVLSFIPGGESFGTEDTFFTEGYQDYYSYGYDPFYFDN